VYYTKRIVLKSRRILEMENKSAIAAIERAENVTPFCSCGEATAPVARDGAVYLECNSLGEEKGSGIVSLLRSIVGTAHVRELIIENELAA
jgi:hypothetical protein